MTVLRNTMKNTCIYLFSLFLMLEGSHAAVFNVPMEFDSIQHAVDSTAAGDTILVAPGIYTENITVSGKNIVIMSHFTSTGDPSFISDTVIDGGQSGSVLLFSSFINRSCELNGFTLTNGSGTMTCADCVIEGGAIFCTQANPTLKNLRLVGNMLPQIDTVVSRGAGLACNFSSPLVENTIIADNSHSGVYLSNNSSGHFLKVDIVRNDGEGMVCSYQSSPLLEHTLVADNSTTGIKCVNFAHPELIHVTVFNHPGYGITVNNSDLILANSILWNNDPAELFVYQQGVAEIVHTNIQGDTSGINTMNSSVTVHEGLHNVFPFFQNPGNGDYGLHIDSPCIDIGTDLFATENDTLINVDESDYMGFMPDLGAFEFQSVSNLIGDLNNDGALNVVDVVILVSVILEGNPTNFQLWASDINMDGMINVVDIVQLIDNILSQ